MRKHVCILGVLVVVLAFSGCQGKKRQAELEADFQAAKAIYEKLDASADEKKAAYQTFLEKWSKDQTYAPQVKKWEEQLNPPAGMVLIPAGSFQMGCMPADGECDKDERPRREINLDAFYLDVHEVTVAEYRQCVEAGKCEPIKVSEDKEEAEWYNWNSKEREDHPINAVDWNNANAYCAWRDKRLPTEVEFEKALRGGLEMKKYPWGYSPKPPARFGNYADETAKSIFKEWDWEILGYNDGFAGTAPVCSMTKNAFGLCDISGNVWEWCADWYQEDWYTQMPDHNPLNETPAQHRSIRGGGWDYALWNLRSSNRVFGFPHGVYIIGGFRCARSAE